MRGAIYLVGAGPGAPDLISLRGLRALEAADVIVLDSLLPGGYLTELGISEATRIVRRLRPGDTRDSHGEILRFMVGHASAGRSVVRLKTGDPHVFGRSAEEVKLLEKSGVSWEAIPGMTAATAVPTAAGLPLTQRGMGRSFAAFTGRVSGGAENSDVPRADTLLAFMSVGVLDSLVERLVRDGHPPSAPAAIVERGTMPWERRVFGELGDMPKLAREQGVSPPALLIIGEAARGPHNRPLILFTGLDPSRFRHLGGLIHWPALEVQPTRTRPQTVAGAVQRLTNRARDWLVLTSPAGADLFFCRLRTSGLDVRSLAGCHVAVAGQGTATVAGRHGILADLVPAEAGSGGLLSDLPTDLGRVVLVQGEQATASLQQVLQRRAELVDRLALHTIRPHPELGRPLPHHDAIYFTSPSGVRAYRDAYGPRAFAGSIQCIGDRTLAAVRGLGFDAEVVKPYGHENQDAKKTALGRAEKVRP
ncbi:MAG: uroporphyrinogen-III C-methyltransferase [Candidatus Brocadiia bacterium]